MSHRPLVLSLLAMVAVWPLLSGCREDDLARYAAARSVSGRLIRVGLAFHESVSAAEREPLAAAIRRGAEGLVVLANGAEPAPADMKAAVAMARSGPALDGILVAFRGPDGAGVVLLVNGYTGRTVLRARVRWPRGRHGPDVGELTRALSGLMGRLERSGLLRLVDESLSLRQACGLGPLSGAAPPVFGDPPPMRWRLREPVIGRGARRIVLPGISWTYRSPRPVAASGRATLLWAHRRGGAGPGVFMEIADVGAAGLAGEVAAGTAGGGPFQNVAGIPVFAHRSARGHSTLGVALGAFALRLTVPTRTECDAVELLGALVAGNPGLRREARRAFLWAPPHGVDAALGAPGMVPPMRVVRPIGPTLTGPPAETSGIPLVGRGRRPRGPTPRRGPITPIVRATPSPPSPSPAAPVGVASPPPEAGDALPVTAQARLHYSMGERYLAMDELPEAARQFGRALELDAGLTEAREALKTLSEQYGVRVTVPPARGGPR